MNMIDLGAWETSRAETPNGVLFAKHTNAAGEDWYETYAHNPDRPQGVVCMLDGENAVRFVYNDLSHADPRTGRPVVIVGFPEGDTERHALIGKVLDPVAGTVSDAAPAVPLMVSKAQAQMALFNAGLLDQLELVIAGHPYRPVRIWYESANMWERKNPYINLLGPELNLTDEQIDDLFIEAAKL